MKSRFARILSVSLVLAVFTVLNLGGCAKKQPTATLKTTTKATVAATTAKPAATTAAKTTALASTAADIPDTGDTGSQPDSGDSFFDTPEDVADIIKGPSGEFVEGKPPYDEEPLDLKGRTVKISVSGAVLIPFEGQGTMQSTKLAAVLRARISQIEPKYNCKIVYEVPAIGAAFFNNFVQAMVAGVSYGDVVQSNTQYVAVSSKNNYISALEGYFNMDSPLFNDPRVRFGNWNGHWYGLREQIATPRHTITYNRLIFEQSGVESPYEAYKRGQWTWSTMIEMGMQTTRDLNGDAIIDQWGLDTWKNSGLPLATIYFLPSNGADAAEFDSNGRLQVTLTTPAAMEAIEFVRSLSSTYNVMPASNKAGEFYQRNLAAMYLGNPQSVTVQLKMDTYGTHGIVSYPVGPRMEGKKMPEGTVGEYFFAVPYNVPESDKKAIARILVDLNAVWNKNIEPYLDTDEYYRDLYKAWDDGTENMEMLIEMGKRQQPLAAAYNSTLYNPITLNLFNDIFLNNLSTASAVDKYKPMIVDAINAMY